MPASFFDKAYFLQSIGWAIANSFWQAAMLWLLYQAVVHTNKKMPALTRYYVSVALLFICTGWFAFTIFQNYYLFQKASAEPGGLWAIESRLLNNFLPFAGVLYFGMLSFYFLRFIRHYLQIRFINTNGLIKAPAEIRIFTTDKALHLGIKKKVQVWLTSHVDVPSVTSFIKPVILLPAALISNLTIEQVNAILLHELAHIKRNDFLLNLIQSLAVLLLFFNPFVRLLNNIIKRERENCCDDWVINFRFNPLEYGKALLLLEEHRQQKLLLAMAATNDKTLLLQRVKRLFTGQQPTVTTTSHRLFQLSGFLLLILTGIILLPVFVSSKLNQVTKRAIAPVVFKATDFSGGKPVVTIATEYYSSIISSKRLEKTTENKLPAKRVQAAKKQFPQAADGDLNILAIVNEDELNRKTNPGTNLIAASHKEKDSSQSSVLVKIEEEQSGKKQRLTYYFDLKNDSGKIAVKPLLFIKKFNLTKLKTGVKPASIHKKRVTT